MCNTLTILTERSISVSVSSPLVLHKLPLLVQICCDLWFLQRLFMRICRVVRPLAGWAHFFCCAMVPELHLRGRL